MLRRDKKATGVTPFRMSCLIHPTLGTSQSDNFSYKSCVVPAHSPPGGNLVMTKKLVENKYILFRLFVRVVLGSGQYRCRLPLQVMGDPKQWGP